MSAFDSYYLNIYGDRWPDLKAAMLSLPQKTLRSCFQGYAEYGMDPASIRAAEALRVQTGDKVLDLCAAPGGKTLILLEALGNKGALIANELSSQRRLRLKNVIESHAPEAFQKFVTVTGFDGNLFGLKRKEEFDRILLDAPCSSERHLLEEDPSQKDWKPSRTEQLARRQYSLLCSGILALKAGGTIVYSTCSISPLENDGVIERALKRKADLIQLDEDQSDLEGVERTEFGFQIFPDRFPGLGPIYFSRLRKRNQLSNF